MEIRNNKSEAEQIKDLILLILRHWSYFVVCFIIFGVIGLIYLKIATPVMQVSARVALRNDESLSGGSPMASAQSVMTVFGFGSSSSDNIEDESIKLSSHGYLRSMVEKLELNKVYIQSKCLGLVRTPLYDQSPIVVSTNPAVADTLTKSIHFLLFLLTKINIYAII